MTQFRELFEKELEHMKELGKELKEQANQSKDELATAWKDLEKRWPEMEKRIEEMEKTGGETLNEAATNIIGEVKKAYRQLRESFERETRGGGDR